MESSSVVDDTGAPESWEFADLDDTMSRLRLNDSKPNLEQKTPNVLGNSSSVSASGSTGSVQSRKVSDETLNQVDQFLRDALQNPRERISILRMEQDIEKFVRDPKRQQFEFQQLPTSYLRLAAHRLAQHYSLQSVVLSDNGLADNSGSRIIVCKTSECRLPLVRLADIPVNLPLEDRSVVKVAIKKRPHIRSQVVIGSNSNSLKNNSSKSVEERKEEYNRARARIFSGSSSGTSVNTDGEQSLQDGIQRNALGNVSKVEDKIASWNSDASSSMGLMEPSISSNRSSRTWTKREPIGRSKTNNRVAIFRDREVDKTDPDYDRSYERYMQRFDPGFGLSEGHYTMQPMLTQAFDHNTEFPQLGSSHRPQISAESRSLSLPQHFPGRWSAPSTPAEMSYGHPEMLMQPFNTSHIGAHSTAAMYMHSAQYPCQQPGMPFMHVREPVQPSSQSHQQQPDASFGLARPR